MTAASAAYLNNGLELTAYSVRSARSRFRQRLRPGVRQPKMTQVAS